MKKRKNEDLKNYKKTKKEKGVTLVALVVTIVILIILASVSINVMFGENGIIKLAQDAKKQTEDAITREETELNTLRAEYANIMAGGGEVVLVEQVTVQPSMLELTEGDTASLTAKVMPENAIKKEVTWSSSNDQIATVENGTVTAKKAGEVTITATSTDGSKKQGICRITVKSKFSILPPDQITPEYLEQLGEIGHQEGENWVVNEQVALKLKDEIPITLTTGEQIIAQVADFNHDDLSDGSGKAPFTFITKNMIATLNSMNSQWSNVGGWEASKMRTYCNETVYNRFPEEWKKAIREVNKQSYTKCNDTNSLKATIDKIWILSTAEVGGNGNEGTKYPIFTDNASRHKYYAETTNSYDWWLRSPAEGYYGDDKEFYSVMKVSGDITTHGANDNYGVVIGFCI